ncbi:MAG: hypothetical protein ACR2IA_13320 [Pyrinomonadaceae bacterium]
MKGFSKAFVLICSLHLIICFTVFSQNKPISVKFDEYSEESGVNLKLLAEKTKRFAKHLQKLPKSTNGVIIYYLKSGEADFSTDKRFSAEERNNYVRNLLIKKHRILPTRIVSKTSFFRIDNEIEFWIQPQNAEFPIDTPNISVDCFCPEINMDGSKVVNNKTKPLSFSASVTGVDLGNISYRWKVSDGEIIEGQRTPTIKVDLTKFSGSEISATVQIIGICEDYCENSFTTRIK